MMSKITDFYLKEKLLRQCEKYFAEYIAEEGSGYLTDEDYKMFEDQINFIFEMMDDIVIKYKKENEEEIDAYAQIIDQLCGFLVIGKMNEARLCNILNDIMDGKEDK